MRRTDLQLESLKKKIKQTLLVHINQVKKVRYPFLRESKIAIS